MVRSNFSEKMKMFRETIVSAAAVAAVIPVFQWYSEREDRRIGRIADILQATEICENPPIYGLTLSSEVDKVIEFEADIVRSLISTSEAARNAQNIEIDFTWPSENQDNVNKRLCSEITFYLFSEAGDSFELEQSIYLNGRPE